MLANWFLWSWDRIDSVGKHESLKSSYVFLFLVPIAARILGSLPETIEIHLTHQIISIHPRLPFSWIVFFFAALAVAIANTVYSFCCPSMVKAFRSFSEFDASGRSARYLREQLEALVKKPVAMSIGEAMLVTSGPIVEAASKQYGIPSEDGISSGLDGSWNTFEARQKEAQLKSAFNFVRDCENVTKPWWRFAASICYILGFVLVFVVFAQNVWYVLKFVLLNG